MKNVVAILFWLAIAAAPAQAQTTLDLSWPTVVVMDSVVAENLVHVYAHKKNELPLCLHGSVGRDTAHVDSVSFPEIEAVSPTNTTFINARCIERGNYIGMVHNHNFPMCSQSVQDMKAFAMDVFATVNVVACVRGPDVIFMGWQKRYVLK
jgi:hypothetical protein